METKCQMVAKRIKAEMELKGIGPEKLSKETGLPLLIVDKIMREKNGKVSVFMYIPISRVLHVSMDYLLGLKEK